MVEDEDEVLLRGSAPDGTRSGIETTKRHDASPIMMEFLVTGPLAFVPGGDDACLSPEAALLVSGTCLQIASRLRTRFLLHQRDIRLERQGGAIQSLDRKLLDPGGPVPDVKLKARRLHDTGHPLACHLSADVVLPVIDAYASIGLHGAGKGLLVHPSQPAVRMFFPSWLDTTPATGASCKCNVASGVEVVRVPSSDMRQICAVRSCEAVTTSRSSPGEAPGFGGTMAKDVMGAGCKGAV